MLPDQETSSMNCPNCSGTTFQADDGMVPITEDIITCTSCLYILSDTERKQLEAEVVAERMAKI